MSVIPYRRDIDGLRAVAVLLVVLSHAQFSFFEGGFVGVDVFFVISGYLITAIMVAEIDKGIFSFKKFYLRRIKRIFPALIAMLGVTTYAAHNILLPGQLQSYAKAQFAALLSCANYFLWKFYGGYWRGYSKEFPLTHTWSLSVEEQFYFIWPAVFLLAYTFIPKRFHNKILGLAFVFLLLISQYLIKYPEFAFYMIPARFFEIFMGASAALIFRKPIELDTLIKNYVVFSTRIAGLILILYASIFYKEGLPYPGFNALTPCLGTLLLILPFSRDDSVVTKLFSSTPFVGIGKISYSLYLWHWPIFSLIAYSGHSVIEYRVPALIGSFLLSIASYFVVEQRFRRINISFCTAFVGIVLVPICLSGVYLNGAKDDGFLDRYTEENRVIVEAVSRLNKPYKGAQLGKGSPTSSHLENANTIWAYGKPGPVQALLVGDSHATAIRPFVEMMCEPLGIKGLQISRDSTPFLLNVDFYDRDILGDLVLRKDKREMNEYWRYLVLEKKIKYVFIAAFYSSRIFSDPENPERMLHDNVQRSSDIVADNKLSFYCGLRDTVEFLTDNGVVPVIFKDMPYVRERLSLNYVKNNLFGSDLKTGIPWREIESRHEFEDSVIDKIRDQFPSVVVIDPKKILKPLVTEGQFYPIINGVPLYLDSNHVNRHGAIVLGKEWISAFGNPLGSANFFKKTKLSNLRVFEK
ncbi:acyltransferase family protein [Maridesulfovibrio sp.]|uniref:acyltransferase family protein n=1 Tax=Maridesulfovibrio sp. TaxID=2795000 RepID=UPI003BAA3038